jgi:hypothetical protein
MKDYVHYYGVQRGHAPPPHGCDRPAALATACSFVTVRSAPANDPGKRPIECTQSNAAPALDLVPAVLLLGLSLVLLSDTSGDEADLAPVIAGGVALSGLPFAISSGYGFSRPARCSEMNRRPLPRRPASETLAI